MSGRQQTDEVKQPLKQERYSFGIMITKLKTRQSSINKLEILVRSRLLKPFVCYQSKKGDARLE